jgi:TRAP-type C4-dicarboxylate transport system permease small subunit
MAIDNTPVGPSEHKVGANHPVRRLIELLETIICTIGALGLALMAAVLGVGIISRYVLNQPIPGVYDIIQLSMVWVVFLSFAYTQRVRRHIQVGLLTSRVSPRLRTYLEIGTYFIGFAFFGMMSWQTLLAAVQSFQIGEYWPGLLRTPIYPSKMALFVGVAMLTLRFLLDIIDGIHSLAVSKET